MDNLNRVRDEFEALHPSTRPKREEVDSMMEMVKKATEILSSYNRRVRTHENIIKSINGKYEKIISNMERKKKTLDKEGDDITRIFGSVKKDIHKSAKRLENIKLEDLVKFHTKFFKNADKCTQCRVHGCAIRLNNDLKSKKGRPTKK